MSEEQKKRLQTQLWNIANELRGKMNADEFRDYILGFIFYKYLSEKLTLYANNLLEADSLEYEKLDLSNPDHEQVYNEVEKAAVDHLGYCLKPGELFHRVAIEGDNDGRLVERLEKTLNSIEHSTLGHDSEDDFDKLFSELDLNATKLGKTVSERNELIAKVLGHLDKIDFMLEDSKIDILGDAYEYLISQFASGAGKKAGEFYTPQEVSEILARIVTGGKKQLKNVYDPTCGSGSLLLRVARHVENVGQFFGQEMNNTTYNLARMNMILHDVNFSSFDIRQEDTLEHPQHAEYRFEAIVANPPFSAKWSANPIHLQDDRFSQYGRLAPASKADYAFIQHMIYQLDENGTMAVVMPHGVLFRGAAEGHIREFLIKEKNYLDAVIGLPANLFYGTSIPACILVFKKCRENPDHILFIDASQHFEKSKNQNQLREEDILKILDTYQNRSEEEKYSHVAPLSEIAENGYNLNIPRYVDTFEEEEPIDLDEVVAEMKKIETESADMDKKIKEYTNELGIESPFSDD
ncbi:type I restriction-modification system subunit M [Candidatus Saccharibacteria bacterium]|nr:type I restriction-modification system subunit M [Candidatus Saccharibacteria bacterium]